MFVTSETVLALTTPGSSKYDARVRHISYNSLDVVKIEAVVGVATHIVLEEGEEYLTHAFGDAEAWTFDYQLNHYFIKPIAESASTNLTIVTNKRTYYFRLQLSPASQAQAMYGIKFSYPDNLFEQGKQNIQDQIFNTHASTYYNLDYTMSGDLDIAPVNVWDNGRFTYFKFAANADIPGIYISGKDCEESIVNRHTVGEGNNIIVVHKLGARWVLRLGNRALAIYNEYDNRQGVSSVTGTAASNVRRIIKRQHNG